MGLVRHASIPAASHSARASGVASAVSATIGIRGEPGDMNRDSFAASMPPITGMWRSRSAMSNVCSFRASRTSSPFATILKSCPARSRILPITIWFVRLSSATRTRSFRPPALFRRYFSVRFPTEGSSAGVPARE